MIFKYRDSPVFFDENFAGTGMTRVSTVPHGELGYMWENPNGTYSARVYGKNLKVYTSQRHIGNPADAFRWIVNNQPQSKGQDNG